MSFVLDCDDRRRALRYFGTGSAEVMAEALGRHELVVPAQTVSEAMMMGALMGHPRPMRFTKKPTVL